MRDVGLPDKHSALVATARRLLRLTPTLVSVTQKPPELHPATLLLYSTPKASSAKDADD